MSETIEDKNTAPVNELFSMILEENPQMYVCSIHLKKPIVYRKMSYSKEYYHVVHLYPIMDRKIIMF